MFPKAASCLTSPSAMTEDAFARILSASNELVSTIKLKARANKKSPTRIEGLFPHTRLAGFLPLLSVLSSTTSSCRSVAEWINSTAAASLWCLSPLYPHI